MSNNDKCLLSFHEKGILVDTPRIPSLQIWVTQMECAQNRKVAFAIITEIYHLLFFTK